MPNYRRIARQKALQYGIDPRLFVRQIAAESGFNPNAISPAGAIGIAQIMPATAQGWGVNPRNPVQALDAAARNMARYARQYGGYRNALVAYNAGPGRVGGPLPAETRAYIDRIMGGYTGNGIQPRRKAAGGGTRQVTLSQLVSTPGVTVAPPASTLTELLSQQSKPQVPISAPAPVSFGADRYLRGAAAAEIPSTAVPPRQGSLAEQLAAIQAAPSIDVPGSQRRVSATGTVSTGGRVSTGKAGSGKFRITGPNPGRLTKPLVNFARKVAGVYGKPLTGSDGSNHSKYTVDGNISDHWSGNATDIPASGATLIRMGQAALIAAGMNPKLARRQRGGLFNVNGHQVIFNTHMGGDHTDHLHISV